MANGWKRVYKLDKAKKIQAITKQSDLNDIPFVNQKPIFEDSASRALRKALLCKSE